MRFEPHSFPKLIREAHMQKKKQSFLIIFLLLGAAGVLTVLALRPEGTGVLPGKKIKRVSASSPEAEKLVNQYLWMESQSQEFRRMQIEAQNTYSAPRIGSAIMPSGKKETTGFGVDHSPDQNELNAYQDLHRDRKEYRAYSPDHVIQGQIADGEKANEYQQAYREEFAKQFVENARRHGYEVKLNSDYVVISVKPISRATGESLIPNSEIGPQAQ